MMTPKEKAKDLVHLFFKRFGGNSKMQDDFEWDCAKDSAMIAVDEILNIPFKINCDASERCVNAVIDYYNEVIIEISKL